MYVVLIAAAFLIREIATYPIYPTSKVAHWSDVPKKCCVIDYALNDDLQCVDVKLNKFNYTARDAWQTISSPRLQRVVTMTGSVQSLNHLNCQNGKIETNPRHRPGKFHRIYSIFYALDDYCIENMTNGTTVLVKCARIDSEMTVDKESSMETTVMMKTTTTDTPVTTVTTVTTINMTNVSSLSENKEVVRHCNNFSAVFFWGTETYLDTNVAHVVLSTIVVVVYLTVGELRKSIYDRAVLCHNLCLVLQGCLLTILGYLNLCGNSINDVLVTIFWILMQYFTNATVFWLNVICFDMAQSITRFRWTMGPGQQTRHERNMRFLLYSVFAWGGAFLPAVVAVIFEFYPGIPENTPLKPNYRRYHDGPNYIVNLYFFGLPLLTLGLNNVLFLTTTIKIIRIQQSTKIATRNNVLWKKYRLFVQLYVMMGAPWFFGMIFAVFNKLVVMKICRLIWPILWLLMLVIKHKKLRQKLANKLPHIKKKPEITESST